jgi:hypothetical protein
MKRETNDCEWLKNEKRNNNCVDTGYWILINSNRNRRKPLDTDWDTGYLLLTEE